MPTPYTFSPAALIAAHTAFLNLIDTGAAANATITVHDSLDVLLGTITLDAPSGVVNGTTGQLTFTILTQEASAPATGEIDHIKIRDRDEAEHLTIPATFGAEPVAGYAVFNTLFVQAGKPVEIDSLTLG